MNTRSLTVRMTLAIFALMVGRLYGFSQDSSNYSVTSPFSTLPLTNAVATGNTSTGTVEIRMEFQNKSPKSADVYLSLGAFNDFGITDGKGNRYKIFTNEGLIESSPINQGYKNIGSVALGNSKLHRVTFLKDTIASSNSLPLKITIDKVDKSDVLIKEIHVRCIFSPNHVWAGDQTYQVKNIKILWSKP